ncbi:amino acid ABC transporter permease [Nocardioides sp. Iso805N]|uniref:amino acid ABC transporter permease n=1 Tax=Nocardioides sp. Iso805N TaxID=1283287 RepID=UPI001E2C3983|nr:amino acid ABC transporter permease [Nocardioides sp. Iso805N]
MSLAVEPTDGVDTLDRRPGDDELVAARLVARRKPGQWISALVALVAVAALVHSVLTNPHFQWDVVRYFFLRPSILEGLLLTIWLTVAVVVSGYILGIGLAVMRLSRNPVLATVSFGFVWFFRSVPPLVQLLLWSNLASLYPTLSLDVPFVHHFATIHTAHLFTALLAAYVGLTLDVAAFSAEIIRGGLLSVENGQSEAAKSLGLGKARIFWRIVLPQAMPAIVPASGNMVIGMLKATSIISVLAAHDLLHSVQLIYEQNYLIIPLLLVATIWYIILTTVLSIGQYFVERHYARGKGGPAPRGLWEVARGSLPFAGTVRRDLAGLV